MKGAGGYKGGGARAAPMPKMGGGYAGSAPGRRGYAGMPAIANAGGYKSGLGNKDPYAMPARRMPGNNPTTSSDAITVSYTITRSPDGTVSETYSITTPNPGAYTPNDGFNGMPYMPETQGIFGEGIYDKMLKEADEEERKRKEQELREQTKHRSEVFDPTALVTQPTQFMEDEKEILPYIEEAYSEVTGKKLPLNFSLKLCDEDELKLAFKFFKGKWQNGIQGFCINRKQGTSRVFVMKDELAKVMLTIGHEIGHLQTATLRGIEEEAKAYAFSLEWMKKIKEKNIAGLSNVFVNERPAENGLHNVAFEFVLNKMKSGMKAMEIFDRLINGMKTAS